MNEKVEIYIKKLISLALIFFGAAYASMYAPAEIVILISLFILSFIISEITNNKPPFLFQLHKVDTYLSKKGGFWNLFKVVLILIGLVYDIIVWEIWSIFIIFEILLDLILLIKEIIFWVINAVIWFFKLFVPPIIFIYRMTIHYLVKWIWWIYELCFKNITPSWKLNHLIISFLGAVVAIFSVSLFYYIAVISEVDGFIYIGIVLALLPIAWSYGEISAVNESNIQDEPYYEITEGYENGFEAVKHVLYYVTTFFVLFLIQIFLDFFGWIPETGLSLLGLTLSINTFISLIMLGLLLIILFADAILPTHLLKSETQETPFHDILLVIKVILRKGLRYTVSLIPAGFFSLIVMFIPALLMMVIIAFTFDVKYNVVNDRLLELKEAREIANTDIAIYAIDKKIDRMKYYNDFPYNIIKESKNRYKIKQNIKVAELKIEDLNNDRIRMEINYDRKAEDMRKEVFFIERSGEALKKAGEIRALRLNLKKDKANLDMAVIDTRLSIQKKILDIKYLISKKNNVPISFFLLIILTSLFGGLILAFGISYFGNVYYSLYTYKEDDKPTYFRTLVNSILEKDDKQPLLGFTVLAIVTVVLFILDRMYL